MNSLLLSDLLLSPKPKTFNSYIVFKIQGKAVVSELQIS